MPLDCADEVAALHSSLFRPPSIVSALFLLVFCLALGVLAARFAKPPAGLAQGLNWWVLYIAFSALVLHLIPTLQFDWELWFLPASMWLVFLGAWAFLAVLGRALEWPRTRVGALTLVCGLGNTAFIGFPMIEALRGQEALKLAVVADQLGSFLAFSIGGTIVTAIYTGTHTHPAATLRNVLLFPPFVCLVAGAIAGFFGGWPEPVDLVLQRLGATLVPVALFSVGLRLRFEFHRELASAIAGSLLWKLVMAPLVVFLVGVALAVEQEIRDVAVLEGAAGPMISAAILAEQRNLEPQLARTVLGIGILLSLVTVPLANYLLP